MPWLKSTKDGVVIFIHLTPRAKRDAVEGQHGDALKVKIKAPPVDGKANDYLLKFIAGKLSIPRANLALIRGETSRDKQVLVTGLDETEIRSRLTKSSAHDSILYF